MVAHAETDDELAEILGLRIDLPVKFLRNLLQRTTETVCARLALIAPARLQEEIKRILKKFRQSAAGGKAADAGFQPGRSGSKADEGP